MENPKRFFTSKPTILAIFTIISTLLAIPLVVLVSQDKQTIQSFAQGKQQEAVKGLMTGTVAGYIFRDSNSNGIRDFEELPYPYATIRISSKVNNIVSLREIKADSYGYFSYKLEEQTQGAQFKLIPPAGYKTTTQNPVNALTAQKQIFEFGIYGSAPVTPTPSCTPRPACLDSVPRCLVAEPLTGWCPDPSKPVRQLQNKR